jgi:8-oxo-dGTP diphosphatase
MPNDRPRAKIVTAAVLFEHDRLLICQRPSTDHLAELWELPGGKVERGETHEGCLARELREELGIETIIGPHVATSEYVYDRGAIQLVAYQVLHYSNKIVAQFHSATRFVARDEIDEFVFAPADVPLIATIKKDWARYAKP